MFYRELLNILHEALRPRVYLEIGIDKGETLVVSKSRTIAIDPSPHLQFGSLEGIPWLKLFYSTSDEFFQHHTSGSTLEGNPLDLAFIDGWHEFSQVIRDLENVERWAHPGTVIVIHDVIPESVRQARRAFQEGGWTGDVWRVVPFLRTVRPDLTCHLVDVRHSGALIVSGLDPSHSGMAKLAAAENREFPVDDQDYDRLIEAWLKEANPISPDEALHALNLQHTPAGKSAAETAMEFNVDRGMRILPESSWRPVFQRSIDAFYQGNIDEGAAACLTLLNDPGLPAEIRNLTFRNQTFYARTLDEMLPGARWHALGLEVGGESPPDPSPAVSGERSIVLLHPDAFDSPSEEMGASPPRADTQAAHELSTVQGTATEGSGIEHLRPYFVDDELHIAALFHDRSTNGVVRAGVTRFGDAGWEKPWLLGPRAGQFRQGWSPFVTADGPRFVAWWEPTEVFELDEVTGEFNRVALRLAPHIAERFQGGSQGVAVARGYLFLVNETAIFDDGNEVTFCRFVRIDDRFQITNLSPQFFVAARGKDVATGLARQADNLLAGFTSNGATALLATLELAPALAALIPVQPLGIERPSSQRRDR